MTHKELVKLGVDYLLRSKRCNPVFAERGSAKISEIPDVIGWNAHDCIVIECKATLKDLLADYEKPCRRADEGLGSRRYYLISHTLDSQITHLQRERITNYGWGILKATESPDGSVRGIKQIRFNDSIVFSSNYKAERDFLRSRIMQIQRFGR